MTKKKNKGSSPESKEQKVASRSCTPISDAISAPSVLVDNEFSESFARFKIGSLFKQCLGKDRRADAVDVSQIAMSFMVWPILKLASVHCFCAELCHYLEHGGAMSFGAQRDKITGQIQILTYAGLLWSLFQSLITGALGKVAGLTQDHQDKVLEAINLSVKSFLDQALGRYHGPCGFIAVM